MGQTLDNGIFLPSEGERNCYSGLAENWVALDTLVGAYSSHYQNTTIHVTASDKQAWNGKADASALTAHTGDTTIHVTSADKQTWNGKQDALSQTQLDAVNSGIDSTKVQQIATNTSDISSLQSGKANDSNVVHKSGNETISGIKTITDTNLEFKSTSGEYGVSAGDSSVIFKDKNNLQTFKIYNRVFYAGVDNNIVSFFLTQKVDNTYYTSNGIQLFANTGNKNAILRPILANNNADGLSVSLGESNRRWQSVYANNYYYGSNNVEFSTKFVTTDTNQTISGNKTFSSINGVEPSSLSLPSGRSARIDISSYITNLGNGDNNSYTVPANGYIWLHFTSINSAICYAQTSGGLTNYAQTFIRYQGDGLLYAFFPIRKDDKFVVQIYTSSTAVVQNAYFIPCQGNV